MRVYSRGDRTKLRSACRVPCRAGLVLAVTVACSSGRPSAGTCEAERLEVTWPATIERAGATASEQLSATLTPTNVTPEVFDTLARTLVRGRMAASAVVWSVPAFDTDPGGIAVLHRATLSRGETLRVAGVLDGGGWRLTDTVPSSGAQAGVEAGPFVARDVSGTIAVLDTQPVALRLDLTARDSAGETIRVRGDARFGYRRERGRCDDAVAEGRG